MTVKLKPESVLGKRELTPAEVVILEGLPAAIDSNFSTLVTILFAKGVLTPDEDKDELPLKSVVAALYTAAVSIATGRGALGLDGAKKRLDSHLREMMANAEFDADSFNTEGCGDPDCEACTEANAKDAKATAPTSNKVH